MYIFRILEPMWLENLRRELLRGLSCKFPHALQMKEKIKTMEHRFSQSVGLSPEKLFVTVLQSSMRMLIRLIHYCMMLLSTEGMTSLMLSRSSLKYSAKKRCKQSMIF